MIKLANRNHLRLAIHAAGLLYAAGVATLLIANHFLRQTSPFVALAGTFNVYLFAAALPLALGLILVRTRTAVATLILLAVLFLLANPILPPVAAVVPAKMSDQSRAYSSMTAALQDGFRQAGIGLGRTFPNNIRLAGVPIPFPLVRIDYVFHSSHLAATSARVHCIEGQSDHCAVWANLRVTDTDKST